MDEREFVTRAEGELAALDDTLTELGRDELDWELSDGVLTLEFEDGSRTVVNVHRPARQIWLASGSQAWHFDPDPGTSTWRSAGGDELRATLAMLVSEKLGERIEL